MNLRVMNCLSFIVQTTLKIVNILLANMVQPMGRLDTRYPNSTILKLLIN